MKIETIKMGWISEQSVRTEDERRKWRIVEIRYHQGEEMERVERDGLDVLEACTQVQERREGYIQDGWQDDGQGSLFYKEETVTIFVQRMGRLEPNGG